MHLQRQESLFHITLAPLQEAKQQQIQQVKLPAQLLQPLQPAAGPTRSPSICLLPRCAPWPQEAGMPHASCLRMSSRAASDGNQISQQHPLWIAMGPARAWLL